MDLAPIGKARVLAAQGSLAEALALVESALSLDQGCEEAFLLKGSLLLEMGDSDKALEVFERAAASFPRSAAALDGLARCLHLMGRNEEALDWAESARRLLREGDNFRHTASVYLTLVWCLREGRRFKAALAVAEEGLGLSPDAILAQWASTIEQELAEAEKERC